MRRCHCSARVRRCCYCCDARSGGEGAQGESPAHPSRTSASPSPRSSPRANDRRAQLKHSMCPDHSLH
eukprot:3245551-Pleurochrysis_carterae.AAC.2